MEQSPYQRLELFWQSRRIKNASAFADTVEGLTPSALSAMKARRSTPSAALMRAIELAYPDLNGDYILWGAGEMTKGGQKLMPATAALANRPTTAASSLRIAQPTHEEYAALQEELRRIREKLAETERQLALKNGTLSAVEEERTWLRSQVGGGMGKDEASADAAAPAEDAAYMVASRNPDHVEAAPEAMPRRAVGFQFGS